MSRHYDKPKRGPRRWLRWSGTFTKATAEVDGHKLTIEFGIYKWLVIHIAPNGESVERPFDDRELAFRWAHEKAGVAQKLTAHAFRG